MRRLAATLMLIMGLLAAPAWAQMRGGARGGGHSIGRAGFGSRGAFARGGFGSRSGFASGHGARFSTGFRRNFAFRRGVRFRTGFGRNRFFFRRRFFYPYNTFYPGFYGDADSYPVVVQSAPPGDYYPSGYDDQGDLSRAVADLSSEVQRLREEQEQRSSPPQQAQREDKSNPATVLVFKDKHTQEVRNYAIVGKTLWVFNQEKARKVPMAELDLPATAKLNDDRGVDFLLPE